MRPFWHPLSSLLIADPRSFATAGLLKMLLAAGREVQVVYAGERMWPAVRHGARFAVSPVDLAALRPGTVVVGSVGGVPDLLRIVGRGDDGRWRLAADSDPESSFAVGPEALLALAPLPFARRGPLRRRIFRVALEMREALWGTHDVAAEPAATIREKYEAQAPFYAQAEGEELDPALLGRIRERVARGGRILVIGSGTGRECFALAREGWSVSGVDFSPAMVSLAVEESRRRQLEIDFQVEDVRGLAIPKGSLDGVLFTYDFYSFVPDRSERVSLLRRVRGGLRPGGAVFLSARRMPSFYARCVITLQWLARLARGERGWGRSHTRWISTDGRMCRSFVQLFTDRRLRGELRRAGLEAGNWEGGHALLEPVGSRSPAKMPAAHAHEG